MQTSQPDPEPNPHHGPTMPNFLPSLLRLEIAVERFLEVTVGELKLRLDPHKAQRLGQWGNRPIGNIAAI
jgi:hypothetical protein